ncbi:MAG TPA: ABC transporter ATP-binding protein [Dehalococcoidia bacterium]|nr:ABC transporter ATP-binding protein [Dehalococcoidia bacterium]
MRRNQILRLLDYLWHYWYLLPLVLVTMVAATLLDLAAPWLIGVVLIDRVILVREADLLPWVILGLLGAVIFRQGFDFAQRYLLALLSQRVIHHLRCDLYQHIESLPMSYFSRTAVGDLVSRQVNDADALEDGLKGLVTEAGVHLIMVLAILGLLFSLNVKLTLAILPFICLMAASMHIFRQGVKGSSLRVRDRLGSLATLATETLSGIGVVKAFCMERAELHRFSGQSQNILQANLRLARLQGFYTSTVEVLIVGSTVVVVWFAAPQVLTETMTVGALVAYLGYLARFQNPLKGLSNANFRIQKALGAAQRIFAVMDTPAEFRQVSDTTVLPPLSGGISFDHVTFGYNADRPVLKDFSLEVQPGESVALVGPSGAGKTTLISLLLGFYSPDAGRILVDGYPIDLVDITFLRRQVALVYQEPFLFSTTVGENILLGRLEAGPEEVEQAARAANIHEFIAALPRGYDTPVGQRGVALSGGQRQRIALARAFLKDAPILLLDEATTSVDSEAEVLIQQALANLMVGRTTIIIAHRLSSLYHAQRIFILEDGRITEEGSHQELLAGPGLYRRLHNLQALDGLAPA